VTSDLSHRLKVLAERPEDVVVRAISDTARDAAREIDRLEGLLAAHGIHSGTEYICRCGLRRDGPSTGETPF